MANGPATLSDLLHAIRQGEAGAMDRAFECVYDELMRLASVIRRDKAGATLNTTGLVHDAYAKLQAQGALHVESRLHFMRIAARAMRQVLFDVIDQKNAQKRGGGQLGVTLNEEVHGGAIEAEDYLSLHKAITRLETFDARQAQIVECRFFAGLSIPETAQSLGISVATVNREWKMARAWLAVELGAEA